MNARAEAKTISLFDNTRISAFKTCERYYYFAHVRHWRPDSVSVALIFGSAWHDAMDSLWSEAKTAAQSGDAKAAKSARDGVIERAYAAFCETWTQAGMPKPEELSPDELDDLAPRTPMVAREMLYGYVEARSQLFADPSFEVLAIERPFAVPILPNGDSLLYVGRLDKVFSYRGKVHCGEHKTTTSYKRGGPFRSDFIDSFAVSAQIDGYLYALRAIYGDKAGDVWIDGALVHKTEHDGFKIIPESRAPAMLDSWLWETHNWIGWIAGSLTALEERGGETPGYMPTFPRNTNSCVQYGRCPYLDICRVIADPRELKEPPLGYHVEPWSPFKEIDLAKLGIARENTTEPVPLAVAQKGEEEP